MQSTELSNGWLRAANDASARKAQHEKNIEAQLKEWFKTETGREIVEFVSTVIEDTEEEDRISDKVVDNLGDVWTIFHKSKKIVKSASFDKFLDYDPVGTIGV